MITYCSSVEILDICKTCQRNDMNRIVAMRKEAVNLTFAKPRKIKDSLEECNLYLKQENQRSLF